MKHPQNSRGAATRLWRSRRARWATAFTALLIAGLAGYGIRAALASGIPSTQALTYAGVLEDGAGTALTGAHNVQVAVYDAATAGNLLCQMTAAQSVTLANGRFVVSLPDACAASFGSKSDTWVDVAVDGATTGRSKVGVVPYAIEANHAVNATNATNATTAANAPIVTGWQAYTPVLSRDGGATVANNTSVGEYRRVGDSLEVVLQTNFTAAPASGATWYQWSLPAGLSIDQSLKATQVVGGGMTGQGLDNNIALVTYVRSKSGVSATANGAGTYYVNDTAPIAFGGGGAVSLYFTVPIIGWTATK